jgi:hypothetical protein
MIFKAQMLNGTSLHSFPAFLFSISHSRRKWQTVLDIPQDVMLAFKHENTITTPLRTKQIIRVGCHHHEYSNEPLGRVGVHAGLTRQELALPHHPLTAGFFQSQRETLVNFSTHVCSSFPFLPRIITLGAYRRA